MPARRSLAASIAALLVSALFAQSGAPDRVTFNLVYGWEDIAMETYTFSNGGATLDYTRETGDESGSLSCSCALRPVPGGYRLTLLDIEYGAIRPPFGGADELFVQFYREGRVDLMLAWNETEVIGVYSSDPEIAVAEATWRASSEFSETLKGKQYVYPASNVGDRSLTTFWAEAAKGPGRGEWLEATISHWGGDDPEYHKPLFAIVFPGVPIDAALAAKNASPKVVVAGTPGTVGSKSTLEKGNAPQLVSLASALALEKLRFTFQDVYPGSAYEDMCVGEIVILGR
jgi:hypothetical protein